MELHDKRSNKGGYMLKCLSALVSANAKKITTFGVVIALAGLSGCGLDDRETANRAVEMVDAGAKVSVGSEAAGKAMFEKERARISDGAAAVEATAKRLAPRVDVLKAMASDGVKPYSVEEARTAVSAASSRLSRDASLFSEIESVLKNPDQAKQKIQKDKSEASRVFELMMAGMTLRTAVRRAVANGQGEGDYSGGAAVAAKRLDETLKASLEFEKKIKADVAKMAKDPNSLNFAAAETMFAADAVQSLDASLADAKKGIGASESTEERDIDAAGLAQMNGVIGAAKQETTAQIKKDRAQVEAAVAKIAKNGELPSTAMALGTIDQPATQQPAQQAHNSGGGGFWMWYMMHNWMSGSSYASSPAYQSGFSGAAGSAKPIAASGIKSAPMSQASLRALDAKFAAATPAQAGKPVSVPQSKAPSMYSAANPHSVASKAVASRVGTVSHLGHVSVKQALQAKTASMSSAKSSFRSAAASRASSGGGRSGFSGGHSGGHGG